MAIVLGDNRYGKAETRLVRVDRVGEAQRSSVVVDEPEVSVSSVRRTGSSP